MFKLILARLWSLFGAGDYEVMGKNRAVKLMLAKAEREHSARCLSAIDPQSTGFYSYGGRLAPPPPPPRDGFPDRNVRAEYFSYEGELK